MYVLQILDWYCASMSVILVCICECIAFCWIYGKPPLALRTLLLLNLVLTKCVLIQR